MKPSGCAGLAAGIHDLSGKLSRINLELQGELLAVIPNLVDACGGGNLGVVCLVCKGEDVEGLKYFI